jgi:hypothetical protein
VGAVPRLSGPPCEPLTARPFSRVTLTVATFLERRPWRGQTPREQARHAAAGRRRTLLLRDGSAVGRQKCQHRAAETARAGWPSRQRARRPAHAHWIRNRGGGVRPISAGRRATLVLRRVFGSVQGSRCTCVAASASIWARANTGGFFARSSRSPGAHARAHDLPDADHAELAVPVPALPQAEEKTPVDK